MKWPSSHFKLALLFSALPDLNDKKKRKNIAHLHCLTLSHPQSLLHLGCKILQHVYYSDFQEMSNFLGRSSRNQVTRIKKFWIHNVVSSAPTFNNLKWICSISLESHDPIIAAPRQSESSLALELNSGQERRTFVLTDWVNSASLVWRLNSILAGVAFAREETSMINEAKCQAS